MARWPSPVALVLCLGAAAPAARAADCSDRAAADPAAIRAVVVIAGEDDPAVLRSVAALGANLVVTQTAPRASTAAAASAAGLGYLPRLSIPDVDRLVLDGAFRASVRAMPAIVGFHYIDLDVTEGFALPSTQEFAYGALKALFPDRLVLYATRLDPIATQPGYLPAYYRPEFTDLVTPYFYPVGTTPIGTFEEAAVFWWGGALDGPLAGISDLPPIGRGVAQLFEAAPGRPSPSALSPRALRAPAAGPPAGSSTGAVSTRRARRPGGW